MREAPARRSCRRAPCSDQSGADHGPPGRRGPASPPRAGHPARRSSVQAPVREGVPQQQGSNEVDPVGSCASESPFFGCIGVLLRENRRSSPIISILTSTAFAFVLANLLVLGRELTSSRPRTAVFWLMQGPGWRFRSLDGP